MNKAVISNQIEELIGLQIIQIGTKVTTIDYEGRTQVDPKWPQTETDPLTSKLLSRQQTPSLTKLSSNNIIKSKTAVSAPASSSRIPHNASKPATHYY